MSANTNTLVNTTAAVIVARHRAVYAWCIGESAQLDSFMPTTKHQRLREPSSG
jgi:hypothetical protein